MDEIRWGIIGCGDVTEMKSGPAFNKVANSKLHAVMRRDKSKAADYAQRHNVPVFYNNAEDLINDPAVNAIYIATPPNAHETYALAAIHAGKPVYLEKPMSTDHKSAGRIASAAREHAVKLSIAHYRREQPIFKKLKKLLTENAIGKPYLAEIRFSRPPATEAQLQKPGMKWRLDPAISGGGLFHDLAPHQLDLLIYFFGTDIKGLSGFARNTAHRFAAEDLITGIIDFRSGMICNGLWNFNAANEQTEDSLIIYGTKGRVAVQVFQHEFFVMECMGKISEFHFDKIPHVQQPMIERVVQFFQGMIDNPCPAEEGVMCMEIIDKFTGRHV